MNKSPTINYCIATYEGSSTNPKYKLVSKSDGIHQHMVRLAELIPSLKIPLTQITIVKPVCFGEKFYNYYRIEEWRKLIPDVEIVVLDFEHPELFSYGQWIHAYQNFPNFDYYITTEDDYCFDHVDFTSILLELFMKKIPSNIGYLSSLVQADTAAIAVGMMSRETMELQDVEKLKKYANNGPYIQVEFSKTLFDKGIPILDTANEYRALYWADGVNQYGEYFSSLVNYSVNKNLVENLIVPVQYFQGTNIVNS
jgi:hypothetical protein